MFSQYEPVAGRERRRKTRGEKIKQRMLRSSYDENTRSYTRLRASNSCVANCWLELRSARSLSLTLSLTLFAVAEQARAEQDAVARAGLEEAHAAERRRHARGAGARRRGRRADRLGPAG